MIRIHRFDGKLGIWPFITVEQAKRSSRNRPAGTPVTKAKTLVTNVEYRQFIIEKLLPAMKEKWPSNVSNCVIKIHQDND